MKSKALIYIFILNLLDTSILSAQLTAYKPLRTGEIINLDGKLLESAWTKTESIDDFMQMEPTGGTKPSAQTKVCMIYNDDYLYIGFRCYENEPSKLVRNGLEYDYSFIDDDGVAIVIDSYNDKSTGIVFATNLNNAKRDRGMSQDGTEGNLSFNTFWDTKSVVEANEYTVEMKIPFQASDLQQKILLPWVFSLSEL